MTVRISVFALIGFGLVIQNLQAGILTPNSMSAPFGVQPFAGLGVTGGVTDPFFADLSGLSFPGSGVVDILGDLQALDPIGNPISTFGVSSVTLMQGAATLTPELDPFSLPSAMTYSSTLNPLNQVTLDPSQFNLGFAFQSDPSFQYSYTLSVTGIPDGGFLIFNDVEGAQTPEPGFSFATALTLFALIGWRNRCWSPAIVVRPKKD